MGLLVGDETNDINDVGEGISNASASVVAAILSLLLGGAVYRLLHFHLWLVAKGITTNEYFKAYEPGIHGICGNSIRRVCGPRIVGRINARGWIHDSEDSTDSFGDSENSDDGSSRLRGWLPEGGDVTLLKKKPMMNIDSQSRSSAELDPAMLPAPMQSRRGSEAAVVARVAELRDALSEGDGQNKLAEQLIELERAKEARARESLLAGTQATPPLSRCGSTDSLESATGMAGDGQNGTLPGKRLALVGERGSITPMVMQDGLNVWSTDL